MHYGPLNACPIVLYTIMLAIHDLCAFLWECAFRDYSRTMFSDLGMHAPQGIPLYIKKPWATNNLSTFEMNVIICFCPHYFP